LSFFSQYSHTNEATARRRLGVGIVQHKNS
jgi:hypothetical protein